MLSVYMPEDRRQALAECRELADRSQGAALFADISGFTPLAERLVSELGNRRGAEELTHYLNIVFDALISSLHRYQGSVIGFSGDAITCWLDGDHGLRATACALEMQGEMGAFTCIDLPSGQTISLGLKTAIACGSIRRFLVGDPRIQVIDVMFGRTLDHLATTEHQAGSGEVVLHPSVTGGIRDHLKIAAWREDADADQRFAIVNGLTAPVPPMPWPLWRLDALSEEQVRPWLLPPVYKRLSAGLGRFLAELRPAVAIFVQFLGIDYEADVCAGEKLDVFIREVMQIIRSYDGSLIQLTVGDKGSYLYGAFGAPIAHEDDAVRAVSAAQKIMGLRRIFEYLSEMRIGISQGRMRTGDYGGQLRRTYGVLGDEVNVAARLMQAANPGQILASSAVWQSTADNFYWDGPYKITLKGKQAPVEVFDLLGVKATPFVRAFEAQHTLPMVGREKELQEIDHTLEEVCLGHGQVVAITGDAGVGKSRLVEEVVRRSTENQFAVYGGACQSFGTRINYLVWQNIFRSLFGLDPAWTRERQIQVLEGKLEAVNPLLVARLPLLGSILGLEIPDNELTSSLDAKLRKGSLEALLVDCLKSRAQQGHVLLVLEDCHWIDGLSRDLLVEVGKTTSTLPVLVVLVYRLSDSGRLQKLLDKARGSIREIHLTGLSQSDVNRLITLKVAELFGGHTCAPPALIETIISRSEGNPFYVEELLNFLRDRDIDPQNFGKLEGLALPDTLQCLILSRMDQLAEKQKITLKIASVIGREFKAAWLGGYYLDLGDSHQIQGDLDKLSQIEILSLRSTAPELIYTFKHILTQEVAYESLPFATRATLHDQLGQFIERTYHDALRPYLNLLAYHYDHSENVVKQREYLVKAGEASQIDYANEAAIDYFERVLPLISGQERAAILKKLGQVLEHVGRWAEAEKMYQQGIELAGKHADLLGQAGCQAVMGELQRKQGNYAEACTWLDRAEAIYQAQGDEGGLGQVLHYRGTVAAHQGEYDIARNYYAQSLAIRRRLNDQSQIASLLSNLGIIARFQGQGKLARSLHEEALEIRRALGDKWAIGVSLNNLGNVAIDQGQFEEARALQEEGLAIRRAVGDRWAIANALNNLGNLAREQGKYEDAGSLYHESLTIIQELGDQWALSYLLEDLGCLAVLQDQPERAVQLIGAAAKLRETIGAPLSPAEKKKLAAVLDQARLAVRADQIAQAKEAGRAMSLEQAIKYALDVAVAVR